MQDAWIGVIGGIAGGTLSGGVTFAIELWRKRIEDRKRHREVVRENVLELQDQCVQLTTHTFAHLNALIERDDTLVHWMQLQTAIGRCRAMVPHVYDDAENSTANQFIRFVTQVYYLNDFTAEQKQEYASQLRNRFSSLQDELAQLIRPRK